MVAYDGTGWPLVEGRVKEERERKKDMLWAVAILAFSGVFFNAGKKGMGCKLKND